MNLIDLLDVLKRTPLTAGFAEQMELLRFRYGVEYIQVAEGILHLFELLDLDPVKVSRKYIYDYLKQLEYFIKNEDYGHEDFTQVKSQIYDNDKIMMETYLPGLLLSYAYTTILGAKNHFFLTEFVTRLDEKMDGIEIGFGEGFYLWEILNYYPQMKISGYDISPHAVKFASDLLNAASISVQRFHLQCGNIFEGIPRLDGTTDFCICAELIEHIPNPEIGVREISRMMKKNGLLYLTTVINSNHMDHISNFESPSIVKAMLEKERFEVISENIYNMADDFPESQDISVGLAFVAKKL